MLGVRKCCTTHYICTTRRIILSQKKGWRRQENKRKKHRTSVGRQLSLEQSTTESVSPHSVQPESPPPPFTEYAMCLSSAVAPFLFGQPSRHPRSCCLKIPPLLNTTLSTRCRYVLRLPRFACDVWEQINSSLDLRNTKEIEANKVREQTSTFKKR